MTQRFSHIRDLEEGETYAVLRAGVPVDIKNWIDHQVKIQEQESLRTLIKALKGKGFAELSIKNRRIEAELPGAAGKIKQDGDARCYG